MISIASSLLSLFLFIYFVNIFPLSIFKNEKVKDRLSCSA